MLLSRDHQQISRTFHICGNPDIVADFWKNENFKSAFNSFNNCLAKSHCLLHVL